MDRPVYLEVWKEQKERLESEVLLDGGMVRWAHIAILTAPVFNAAGISAIEARLAQIALEGFDEPTLTDTVVWEAIPTLEVDVRVENWGIEQDDSATLVTSTIRIDYDGQPGNKALEACAFRVAAAWQRYLQTRHVRVEFDGRRFEAEFYE